jgi:hypothetical protein
MRQELGVTYCHTFAAASLASLPVSLRQLRLDRCFGMSAHSLAHLGRLTALEDLTLRNTPGVTNDEGMEHLAPQLHGCLSSLFFIGCDKDEVSADP